MYLELRVYSHSLFLLPMYFYFINLKKPKIKYTLLLLCLLLILLYVFSYKVIHSSSIVMLTTDLTSSKFVTKNLFWCTSTCVKHFYNIVEGYFFFYNKIELFNILFTKYNLNTEVQHSILWEFITNSMPYVYNSIQSNMNSLGEPLIAEITPLNRVRFIGFASY